MVIEKHRENLDSLEKIARKQGNKINRSMIFITVSCSLEEQQAIIDYFISKGIEIIDEDIEPDASDEDGNIVSQVNPFDPSKIDIRMDKITMDALIKRIRNNELELQSSFQRSFGLWSKKQKSQLIESILLRIPLPAFYFDASDDDKWLIIDGLQRISTIKEFVVDETLVLTGVEFLTDLNGMKYSDLPRAFQRRIEETNLNAYLINPTTPKNVKYNIFKRINTGGLVLEAQEIRNALYQGQATSFIEKLAKRNSFILATDGSIKSDRMQDREFGLRYVAFTELSLEEYDGRSDDFLNSAMEYLTNVSKDRLDEIVSGFDRVMKAARAIFGDNAFRKMAEDGRRRPINKALFESWSHIMNKKTNWELSCMIEEREAIIKEFILLCKDQGFQNVLRSSDRNSIYQRIYSIESLLDRVLSSDKEEMNA